MDLSIPHTQPDNLSFDYFVYNATISPRHELLHNSSPHEYDSEEYAVGLKDGLTVTLPSQIGYCYRQLV
jgi:hypothetical protein